MAGKKTCPQAQSGLPPSFTTPRRPSRDCWKTGEGDHPSSRVIQPRSVNPDEIHDPDDLVGIGGTAVDPPPDGGKLIPRIVALSIDIFGRNVA